MVKTSGIGMEIVRQVEIHVEIIPHSTSVLLLKYKVAFWNSTFMYYGFGGLLTMTYYAIYFYGFSLTSNKKDPSQMNWLFQIDSFRSPYTIGK